MIPRIIHQLWKTTHVPEAFRHWQQSWREMHPDFEYRLWTNEAIEDFIRDEPSDLQSLFYSYRENICRIDLARYLILQRLGGLYVDLDFECLRPHHQLLEGRSFVIGVEPSSHAQLAKAKQAGIGTIACNAWMASEPGHPFWRHLLDHLLAVKSQEAVLDLTGPFALTRAAASYGARQLSILPSEFFYPVDKKACWSGEIQDLEFFEAQTREAFALHHWAGTWFRTSDYLARLPLPRARAFVRKPNADASEAEVTRPAQPQASPAPDAVRVSCLMVTRGDPHRVRHSIRGFLLQTHPAKELVIVTDVDPARLLMLRAEYPEDNIRWVFSDPVRKLTLGEMRNLALDSASGNYVAQWDDDDLYDPSRLEHQMAVLQRSHSDACMLSRWTIWWPSKRRLFISGARRWEGSLVCARAAMPRYPALPKGEDTVLVTELIRRNQIVFLDAPRLYIYVIHGANTWHEAHFEFLFKRATVDFSPNAYHRVLREVGRRVDVAGYFRRLQAPVRRQPTSTPSDGSGSDQPSVLILTPMRNTKKYLERYFELVDQLDYPRERLSVGILEGDSTDGTLQGLLDMSASRQHQYASIRIEKYDTGLKMKGPRWQPAIQFERRSKLARVRNTLLGRCLGDQEWVLWIDADVIDYPKDLIQRLLSANQEIVAALCVKPDGSTFDKNTFIFNPDRATAERPEFKLDGIFQPPAGVGRRYLDSAEAPWVPVDSVGGTALLVRAELHRQGLVFPTFSYKGYLETEGLAAMALDMGVQCWGGRDVRVIHADE